MRRGIDGGLWNATADDEAIACAGRWWRCAVAARHLCRLIAPWLLDRLSGCARARRSPRRNRRSRLAAALRRRAREPGRKRRQESPAVDTRRQSRQSLQGHARAEGRDRRGSRALGRRDHGPRELPRHANAHAAGSDRRRTNSGHPRRCACDANADGWVIDASRGEPAMRVQTFVARCSARSARLIVGLPLTAAPAARAGRSAGELLPDLILREIVLREPDRRALARGALQPARCQRTEQSRRRHRAGLQQPDGDAVLDLPARIVDRRHHLCVRRIGRHAPARQRQLRAAVRRTGADDRPAEAQRRIQLPAHVVRHVRRTESRDGSIKFYLRHQDCCTFEPAPQPPYSEFSPAARRRPRQTPPFEGDVIEAALSLEATTHTTAVVCQLRRHRSLGRRPRRPVRQRES